MAKVKAVRHARRPAKKKAAAPKKKAAVKKTAAPKKKAALTKLKRKKVPNKSIMVYGPPGVGKTAFALNFEDPIFICDPGEFQGVNDLIETGQAPAPKDILISTSFQECCHHIDSAIGKCTTLVIDSLTGIQHQAFTYCCETDYQDQAGNPDWSSRGFYSYQQGPATTASRYWEPEFIGRLIKAYMNNMNVILIAHSEIKPFDDPVSSSYDRYVPFLHKQTWQYTKRWVSQILFYNYEVDVVKQGQSTKRKPDTSTERRVICTTRSAVYEAKNHHGLPHYIMAGDSGEDAYNNYMKAYTKAYK